MRKINNIVTLVLVAILSVYYSLDAQAQQDPQFTHYMYNTMSINPGYTGSLGHGVITGIGRTQWVGFKGAPDSQTLSYHTPFLYSNAVGLGFNLTNDKLGPLHETFIDGNASYAISTSAKGKLALGIKLGGRLLNIDWATDNGMFEDKSDPAFAENIKNGFLPTLGAGLYYYTDKGYLGLSVPNFMATEHYDSVKDNFTKQAVERMHFFLIGGYVFDLSENIKFKPASLVKAVEGAPLIVDLSANFLINKKFTAGLAWRWDDSVSALLGFQVSRRLYAGYGFDLTTTKYSIANSGTHEFMLRYEFRRKLALKSPRFF